MSDCHTNNSETIKQEIPDAKAVIQANTPMTKFNFSYQLKKPNKKYKLPEKLTEVSGIQYIKENTFACVQDETGKIYIYDTQKGKIIEDYHFAGSGDYEDLELVGSTLFVIRSDGRLYKIDGFPAEKMEVRHRDLPLSEKNDVEGLCYDPATEQLLIACKAEAGLDKNIKKKKAVYSFDVNQLQFNTQPRFLIDKDILKEVADEKKLDFNPSGIAKHPIDGYFYLIASAGNLLVILDDAGKVLHVEELDNDEFKQPEGITFDPQGNLYISNEGRSGKGNILYFKYQNE